MAAKRGNNNPEAPRIYSHEREGIHLSVWPDSLVTLGSPILHRRSSSNRARYRDAQSTERFIHKGRTRLSEEWYEAKDGIFRREPVKDVRPGRLFASNGTAGERGALVDMLFSLHWVCLLNNARQTYRSVARKCQYLDTWEAERTDPTSRRDIISKEISGGRRYRTSILVGSGIARRAAVWMTSDS